MTPIMSAQKWKDNSAMIADIARLGYIKDTDVVLDPTFGKGNWWKEYLPPNLIAHSDMEPWASDGTTRGPCDFRDMDYPDASFDVIAFDPRYAPSGGKETSTIKDLQKRYGGNGVETPLSVQQVMHDGLSEMARLVKLQGLILAKCCAYTGWGHLLWEGDVLLRNYAVDVLGLTVADRFDFITNGSPQDARRTKKCPRCGGTGYIVLCADVNCEECGGTGRVSSVQLTSRRNASCLYVFKKIKKRGSK